MDKMSFEKILQTQNFLVSPCGCSVLKNKIYKNLFWDRGILLNIMKSSGTSLSLQCLE